VTPRLTPGQGKTSKFDPAFLLDILIAPRMNHQAQVVKPEFDSRLTPGQGQRSKFDRSFLLHIRISHDIGDQAQVVKHEFDLLFDPRSVSKVKY